MDNFHAVRTAFPTVTPVVDVVVRGAAADTECSLAVAPRATAGEVLRALGADPERALLVVDGEAVVAAAAAELRQGSRVEVAGVGWRAGPAARPGGWELRVVGGCPAGQRWPLPVGRTVVGRLAGGEVAVGLGSGTVSGVHAAFDLDADGRLRVTDLGSRHGTSVAGRPVREGRYVPAGVPVRVGATLLAALPRSTDRLPVAALGRPDPRGLVALHRSPRPAPPPLPAAIEVPGPDQASRRGTGFSWAAVLAPLVMGVGIALVTHTWMFALFVLMSPVMMLGSWWEDRRRNGRSGRRGRAATRAEMRTLRLALLTARQVEAAGRSQLLPDVAEVLRRASEGSRRVWERRDGAADFQRLRVGSADLPWLPPVADGERHPAVACILDALPPLADAPVPVVLAAGDVLGVVGPRALALAVARSLVCQAAVHSGPADVAVLVQAEALAADDWAWASWLPHARQLAEDDGDPVERLRQRSGDGDPARLHLLVVDGPALTQGRGSALRAVLHGLGAPVAGVVVAPLVEDLPAACRVVLALEGPDGVATLLDHTGVLVTRLVADGVDAADALACARSLARLDDPDLVDPAAGLPDRVALVDLLDADGAAALTPEGLAGRWGAGRPGSLSTPVGVGRGGPLWLDLVADGPHGLLAGTTGAGKSELLRTLVAGLAATHSPDDVCFVLVDYKGGSAFAECARLPHTVGLVTDLDERLGERALVCLEAELRHRERLLGAAGVSDLPGYLVAGRPLGPLPRLLVVVDEFATMATELPDFLGALVGVAQRGRSLGMHLLLATQRPAGVVRDDIRANTALRVALRVQDDAESTDVLGVPLAAAISRRHVGRGWLRLGPGEVEAFQTAYVSGRTDAGSGTAEPVVVHPRGAAPLGPQPADAAGGPSDLVRLVEAARGAFELLGLAPPRRPWPDPLPELLSLDDLPPEPAPAGVAAVLGLADEPERQRRRPLHFEAARGHLLLYGVAGSGSTAALAALALGLATRHRPDEVHLYVLDMGSQQLGPLAALPHVGAVVGAGERERQERLLRLLREELSRRQELARLGGDVGALPVVVLVVDSWGGLEAALDDVPGMALKDGLARVVADGPALGLCVVASADRVNAVPVSLSALISEKLVLRLADAGDAGVFGLRRKDLADVPPGRAVHVPSGRDAQLLLVDAAALPPAVAAVLEQHAGHQSDPRLRPAGVGTLPDLVRLREVLEATGLARPLGPDGLPVAGAVPAPVADPEEGFAVPLALSGATLAPTGWRLAAGEHALVLGAARTGRSSVLAALAEVASVCRPGTVVTALTPRRSGLRGAAGVHRELTDCSGPALEALVETVLDDARPQLLLVDDAEHVDDPLGSLARLLRARRPGDVVVAAARTDALRGAYGHWTGEVRAARHGLVLRPRDGDLDLFGCVLPRGLPRVWPPGRGVLLVDGEPELVQVVLP